MAVTLGPKLGLLINGNSGDNYTDQFRPFLRFFDAMVQGNVINSTATTPPTSPNNGDAYLLLGAPTGVWAAYQNSIAVWSTEITTAGTNNKVPGWEFWTPNQGWLIWDVASGFFRVYTGSGWTELSTGGGGGGGADILEGTDASKPSAGTAGRIFLTTDTNKIYYDTGSAWIAVGPSGAGTVTSVAITVPSRQSVSGSPVTTNGTFAISDNAQNANTFFRGPVSGSAAAPSFGAIVPADLPLASASAFGAVKVDGTTITATGGVISAVGGSGNATEIQSIPVSATAPTTGQVLEYNGSEYVPTTPSSGGGGAGFGVPQTLSPSSPNGGTTYTLGTTPTTPAASFYFVNGSKMIYGSYYTISGDTLTIIGSQPPPPNSALGDTHELYAY
jgi:hypothetical protein